MMKRYYISSYQVKKMGLYFELPCVKRSEFTYSNTYDDWVSMEGMAIGGGYDAIYERTYETRDQAEKAIRDALGNDCPASIPFLEEN